MKIETLTHARIEQVLPLIADYQRFYDVQPNESNNREHFSRLLNEPDKGIQFVALNEDDRVIGFATLYFPLCSLAPGNYCLMNDLFAIPEVRGLGVGRALITHCLAHAKQRGFQQMSWQTALSNVKAQRLYDSLPATRETWHTYTKEVD